MISPAHDDKNAAIILRNDILRNECYVFYFSVEDKRKVLTAAIVGSLGCGVLFVIALGCTRRLFHVQNSSSCSRTRRNFQNLANILQVREPAQKRDLATRKEAIKSPPVSQGMRLLNPHLSDKHIDSHVLTRLVPLMHTRQNSR